jgi:hypothetical protein
VKSFDLNQVRAQWAPAKLAALKGKPKVQHDRTGPQSLTPESQKQMDAIEQNSPLPETKQT